MDKEIADLRSRVEALREQGAPTRTRYTREFRRRVVAVVRARQARGHSLRAVAMALGIKDTTVHRWLQAGSEAGLRPVVVETTPLDQSQRGDLVVFAGSLRIEGLRVLDVVALVRALA